MNKTVQSAGGKARAASLSPEERSQQASDAATVRWSRKDRHVSADLTPEQKTEVTRLAGASGMSVSDWLRAAIVSALNRKAIFRIEYVEQKGDTI